MGRSKTIRTLAFLLHQRETGVAADPVVLVCATSVIGNWQREAARFAPDLSTAWDGRANQRLGVN